MSDVVQEIMNTLLLAWMNAEQENYDTAYRCYDYVNELTSHADEIKHVTTPPELSLLRHKQGEAEGIVQAFPANENSVISLIIEPESQEKTDSYMMAYTHLDEQSLKKNLNGYDYTVPDYHQKNITEEIPHLMVLSTGRCGTMSLYRLLQRSQYLPYHSYLYQSSIGDRYQMLCQHISGNYRDSGPADQWLKTRAAEWLGAISQNRPMAGVNHLDTIYAPTFAKVHPQAKFIYLRRDPINTFESFYTKNQFGRTQLQPLYYKLDPNFAWCYPGYDIPHLIAWYIRFTEVFSRAFGEIMGDRFIELSADKLFERDKEECEKLRDFTNINLDVREHFKTVYNQKAHKEQKNVLSLGLTAFKKAYKELL